MITPSLTIKATNVFLRILPIIAKFFLVLYMGKFFTLADVGIYGLISASTALLTLTLGQKLDYVVMRKIVTCSDNERVLLTRDEVVYFGLNYIALGLGMIIVSCLGFTSIPAKFLFYVFLLSLVEGYANIFYSNMTSLNRQILANLVVLVRSGLWIIPAILLCHFLPDYRTIDTIIIGWIAGSSLSLCLVFWGWKDWPWNNVFKHKINWPWLKDSVKKCSLIWIGAIGTTGGVYIDRFVVEHFLDIEKVGIATLFFSFANTMLTVTQSGVTAFAYPKLIELNNIGDIKNFNKLAKTTTLQVILSGLGMTVFLSFLVPFAAQTFDKPAVIAEFYTFFLMLIGTYLSVNAETPYTILFARHQDKPVWLGNLLFILPVISLNLFFVPLCGLSGIGYSSIISGLFLLSWRWYFALQGNPLHHKTGNN